MLRGALKHAAVHLNHITRKYPIRGNSDQNKVVQVNCISLQGCKAGLKVQVFSELLKGIQMNDGFLLNTVKPLLSGHLRDLPKCPLIIEGVSLIEVCKSCAMS